MKLSKECIEAIKETNEYKMCGASGASYTQKHFMQGATEALTNPEIYEKAGLMQTDGLLPESFNNEKVLTLLAISLRHLNAEQLANLLKSITQRSKEATEKAGLISLEDALGFAEWCDVKACFLAVNHWCIHGEISDGCTYTTAQLFQIYQEQKEK